jgi:hypothetical protein
MRDHRNIVVETSSKSSDGFGKFGAWLFGGVMTIALLDRCLTLAWEHVIACLKSAAVLTGF